MARALWKGAISFSLIHIPVSLHPATRSRALDLDMLDKRDFAPIGFQRINKATGKPVEWKHIVKAYQYKAGEYVVLTDEDFRRANVEATRSIDIQSFVAADVIPPWYFDTPYDVVPEARSAKVFQLLVDALVRSHTYGIALCVIRTRQYVCALVPRGRGLILNTLRFADEILDPGAAGAKAAPARPAPARQPAVTRREHDLALRLIEEMSEPWRPDRFEDTYRNDLLKRIREKARKGQARELTPAAAPEADATAEATGLEDLSALLTRSLAGVGPKRTQARPRRRTRERRPSGASKRRA
jgi:DNA end-binding protein Ku